MKPSMAVQKALNNLENNPEYSLHQAAKLAIKFIGEDAKTYRDAFLLSAVKKKIKDALRHRPEETSNQSKMDFMDQFRKRRFAVKQQDGQYSYKVGDVMTWRDLMKILNERRDSLKNRQIVDDAYEAFMSELAPVMALNPTMQVRDALNMVSQLTA